MVSRCQRAKRANVIAHPTHRLDRSTRVGKIYDDGLSHGTNFDSRNSNVRRKIARLDTFLFETEADRQVSASLAKVESEDRSCRFCRGVKVSLQLSGFAELLIALRKKMAPMAVGNA